MAMLPLFLLGTALFVVHPNEAVKLRSSLRAVSLDRGESESAMQIKSKEEVMEKMTMEEAHNAFMKMDHSKTDKGLVDMVQSQLGDVEHKGRADPRGYAAVDGARDMLNGMIDQANSARETEKIKCGSFNSTQLKILREMENEISYANSEASGAKSVMLKCEQIIYVVEIVQLPTNHHELKEHNDQCVIDIAALKQEIAVVKADIGVMENIVNMVCQEFVTTPIPTQPPSLLQFEESAGGDAGAIVKCSSCKTGQQGVWFKHRHAEPLLSELKSKVAKEFLKENLMSEFNDIAHNFPARVHTVLLQKDIPGFDMVGGAVNITEEPKESTTCNEAMTGVNSSTYHGCQDRTTSKKKCQAWSEQSPHAHQVTAANYPDGNLGEHSYCRNPNGRESIWCYTEDPAVEWQYCEPLKALAAPTGAQEFECVEQNLCKLSKPDCGKLKDRFLEILGGIEDKGNELTDELEHTETSCNEIKEGYEKTIESLSTTLSDQQTGLADGTQKMVQNQQRSADLNEQHRELDGEYHTTMTKCCDNQNAFTGEVCALEKIRGELYRIEGINVFITDCEVSDWVDEECSKTCGGGEQLRERLIIMHPVNGSACPPLKMIQGCNLEGCPIDCAQTEWSGWSDCTANCNTGVQSRVRAKTVEPANGGAPCEEESEVAQCNTDACNQDCEFGEWTAWTMCSKVCNVGHREREKPVMHEAVGLGECAAPSDPSRFASEECNTQSCTTLLNPGQTVLTCSAMVDLIILVDSSGSLGTYGWAESKKMAEALVKSVESGPNAVNVGVIEFSGPGWRYWRQCTNGNPNDAVSPEMCGVQWVSRLSENASDVSKAVEGMPYLRGTTFTSLALAEAEAELIQGRKDAESVVIVITDGRPLYESATTAAATSIKTKAKLMWVPVGSGVESAVENMKQWATQPWEDNVIRVLDFASLDTPTTLNGVISSFCTQMSR